MRLSRITSTVELYAVARAVRFEKNRSGHLVSVPMVNNALFAFERYRPMLVGFGKTCSDCFEPLNEILLLTVHCCKGKHPYLCHIHCFWNRFESHNMGLYSSFPMIWQNLWASGFQSYDHKGGNQEYKSFEGLNALRSLKVGREMKCKHCPCSMVSIDVVDRFGA